MLNLLHDTIGFTSGDPMVTATRVTKSLSLEKELLKEVERTKGGVSTSERVNKLLKAALEIERRRGLDAEAEVFFGSAAADDEASRRAFQAASIRSLARED
jgi:hypothetical protein